MQRNSGTLVWAQSMRGGLDGHEHSSALYSVLLGPFRNTWQGLYMGSSTTESQIFGDAKKILHANSHDPKCRRLGELPT